MVATRSLLAIAVFALAPACGGGDDSTTVIVNDPVDDTVAEGQARGADLADLSSADLAGNDYLTQIGMTASIIGAINDGEIAESDFAVQLSLEGDIFDFANTLILDHEDANADLDDVVAFYGSGYVPSSTADQLAADANANIAALRGAPLAQVDFQFTEDQVIGHAQALVILDRLFDIVGPGEMGDYILDLEDMVDAHLAQGEDLLATFY